MIAPVFEYKIGPFGGKDIVGAVLVNAVDGKHKYYDIKDIPNWVDRVYPADLVIQQLENYGKYTHGYINSVFSQKVCYNQQMDIIILLLMMMFICTQVLQVFLKMQVMLDLH